MTTPQQYLFPTGEPVAFDAPGGPEQQLADMLTNVIRHAADNAPRSLQTEIGPSEIGTPCDRRIGYKLSGVAPVNTGTDPLAAIIGTAAHTWLADAFTEANRGRDIEWLVEQRVAVAGNIGGSGDLFHVPTRTVIDWKFPGETGMRKYKAEGPGEQYRTQIHAYGVGYMRRGLVPQRVAIVFIPRAGRLDGMHVWTEPFNPAVAADAINRVEGIRTFITAAGRTALPLLATTEAYCSWCSWYSPGSTDPTQACPGAAAAAPGTATPNPTAA